MAAADFEAAWAAVLAFVRARTKPQQYDTWFPSLRCLAFSGEAVALAAPNDFYKKWIETHYLGLLRESLFEAKGTEPRIEISVVPQPALTPEQAAAEEARFERARDEAAAEAALRASGLGPQASGRATPTDVESAPATARGRVATGVPEAPVLEPVTAAASRDGPPSQSRGLRPEARGPVATLPPPPAPPRTPRVIGDIRLNPQYVFDEFVVGPSNRLAHAAALAVTENPAHTYNPLFLHGGVGLGKTHLLQAVCHALLTKNPGATVVYLSCEAFVNQYIAALQKGNPETFRERYRGVDMLLIDDIHFLANKVQMQEEFFHTFNTLYNAQRQIILSSDSPPQDIPSLEARLVSRFKWGLVAEIEPPHYETKVAIIKSKAKARGRDLPDDVVDYLANALDSNIRELEGAVLKIIVLASLQNQRIDVELCRAAVRELSAKPGQVTLSEIMTAVANHYNLKVNDLLSKKRSKSIAAPRQVCMYLARILTQLSLLEIGGQLGGRDHSTVLYGDAQVREKRERDSQFRAEIDRLARELQRA